MFKWLRPLYPRASAEDQRLQLAACLLHDTTWRAHPDYRAEICFESVTRANMGAVDHASRVMLGLALMARYKANIDKDDHAEQIALLNPRQREQGEVLGAAMRLGAMLTGAVAGSLLNTSIARERGKVILTLKGSARDLLGEVVEKRLATLALQLGCVGKIELKA